MDKVYHPQTIETKWYSFWEDQGFFKPSNQGPSYCIMLPPPNVTGSLHMGHAFQDTIMDALIRYHRMKQFNTLWQGGTDHAGIATQMVVERQLLQKGISRHDLGRDTFTAKIWEWKAESGSTITQQMRRLGASVDWTRERFTMDDGLSDAVKEVFVRLYDEGLIYKGKRLVNWDPKLHTAVSDLEVISTEEEGHLWHIRYPIEGESKHLVVATTRPETLLGDLAVAVHPDDHRYKDLIGKSVELPLCERLIPIIADTYVNPEFGTGCVKITPAHDFNDYEVGKRHGLMPLNIFDINACLNENTPLEYQGLERFAARKRIVDELHALNLIEKIEPHTLKVPRGDRSGVVIEPYLTEQWYVKTEPLAKRAIEVVETGEITFVPENWSKTYFEWMHNIQDWCISRQLWWGHRIPAWTDEDNNIYVARTEAEVRTKYKLDDSIKLNQDPDVLDTWFSSALWPFSTLGWPHQTPELKAFYPTQVLVTGFDIIFFWVARMIMMGLKFTDQVPFKTVFVHGLIQDPDGQKMSKSKGNILDPLDLIDGISLEALVEKRITGLMQPDMAKKIATDTKKHFPEGISSYGTDALRFTLLALATTGRHIRFDFVKLDGYRNFCNKLWNATRYVLMNIEGKDLGESSNRTLSLADTWLWSQWQQVKKDVETHIENYRFDMVANALYDFTWNTYCDWSLELSKPVLTNPNAPLDVQRGTRHTLLAVLEELIRVIHPFMPFITEEIWQKLKEFIPNLESESTVMLQPYPSYEDARFNPTAVTSLEWIKSFITAIRNIRGETNVAPSRLVSCLCYTTNAHERQILTENLTWVKALAKLSELTFIEDKKVPTSATQIAGDMEIFIPLKGLVDVDVETKRLQKEIDKQLKEQEKSNLKLNNEKFISNAPPILVEEERKRLHDAQLIVDKLTAQLETLRNL